MHLLLTGIVKFRHTYINPKKEVAWSFYKPSGLNGNIRKNFDWEYFGCLFSYEMDCT